MKQKKTPFVIYQDTNHQDEKTEEQEDTKHHDKKRKKSRTKFVPIVQDDEKPKSELYKSLSYMKFKHHAKVDENTSHDNSLNEESLEAVLEDEQTSAVDQDVAAGSSSSYGVDPAQRSPHKVKFVGANEDSDQWRAARLQEGSLLQEYEVDSIASNENKQYLRELVAHMEQSDLSGIGENIR